MKPTRCRTMQSRSRDIGHCVDQIIADALKHLDAAEVMLAAGQRRVQELLAELADGDQLTD